MKLSHAVAPLIGILLAAPTSQATPCRQFVVQKQVVAAEVVYPVVQQVIVPVYGLIPYYSPAAYVAPYAAPAQVQAPVSTTDELLKELILEMRSIKAELRGAPPAKQEVLPKPKEDVRPVVVLMRKACAQCHNEASADMDGGGLTLFKGDGSFAGVQPDMAKRVVRRVGVGSMPPSPAKLADAEKQLIVEAFKQ